MSRSFSGILLIGSAIALPIALLKLAHARKWRPFTMTVAAVALYPVLFAAATHLAEPRLRMWVGIVVVLGVPVWLLSGYIALGIAERRDFSQTSLPPQSSIRTRGVVVLALGTIAWYLGAFVETWSRSEEMVLLAAALYGLVLGGYWLGTGRNLT